MSHPLFEVVTTTAGAVSIRNKVVNEIMHNPVGPWVEANALYIDQSNLRERLTQASSVADAQNEFVVFDVGLGAAANTLATLACYKSVESEARPLRIVSFERDMELLRFALEHSKEFAHFTGFEKALKQILETAYWQEGKVTWELREGDFLDLIEKEPQRAHLIFFDPYSPKVNQDMWTTASFQKIREKSRSAEEGGTTLYTYSQATRIRVALMQAGFFVGQGVATGLKEETTEAATDYQLLRNPLGSVWYSRWQKSHVRYPFDCIAEEDQKACDESIRTYMRQLGHSL